MNARTSAKKTTGAQKLRIIGGEWRSRQVAIPSVEGLRPTPDRVRETLFNWIHHSVPASRCADLFCGSGALGLEALSRGAKSCVFVDNHRSVAQQMRDNLKILNSTAGTVVQANAIEYLKTTPVTPFDLVFLDPPFRKGWLEQIIPLLEQGWLSQRAWVYIEMEKENSLPPLANHWQLLKEKHAGQLSYRLFGIESPTVS